MIDNASIVFSLSAVMWIMVRAVMSDQLRPWYERFTPRANSSKR